MPGFAVIDLETTGFAYNHTDRICEIGVVLLDPHGNREGTYSTLVNPQRDLGAQHIHGIDATDARLAPTFAQIIGDLTEVLAGRVIAAHNSAFDTAFLAAEYARAGWPIGLSRDMTLCTMALASQYLPGAPAKLDQCCAFAGISQADAHHALADAEAAACLLALYMERSRGSQVWADWVAYGTTLLWPEAPRLATTPVTRGVSRPEGEAMASVMATLTRVEGVDRADEYLDLLDRVLADRKISPSERASLDGLTASLGLTATQIAELNRHYMLGIVDMVAADDMFTREERATVIQLANLLDIGDLEIEALLLKAEAQVSLVETSLTLKAGDMVVFTGFSALRKAELAAQAEAAGLVVWPSLKKGVAVVVALDEGTNSGKAQKARAWAIPVIGADAFAECCGSVAVAHSAP
jgi:DNA polymerase-3 subunit epsilon